MASWKKILVEGDNTNLASTDLTQTSSTNRVYNLNGDTQTLSFKGGKTQIIDSSNDQEFSFDSVNRVFDVHNGNSIRFREDNDDHYVALKADANVSANYTITLPGSSPGGTKILQSNSDGDLSWIDTPSGSGSGTTINNNADNLVITGSGTADTLEAEAKLTFSNSVLNVSGTNLAAGNGVSIFGGTYPSSNPYISPVGTNSVLKFGDAATGSIFDFRQNKIAFDDDSTNTYIQADADSPENLEIHADGNIELRADDDVQVIGDINIGGSATIDKVLADTTGLTTTAQIGHGAEITFLGSSGTGTTVGKIYYYDGSTWQTFSSATEAAQKALLGYSLGSTMASGFLLRGFVHADSSSLTAGSFVFGATNASITPTAPTSGFQRIIGHAVANDIVYFNPSQEFIDLD